MISLKTRFSKWEAYFCQQTELGISPDSSNKQLSTDKSAQKIIFDYCFGEQMAISAKLGHELRYVLMTEHFYKNLGIFECYEMFLGTFQKILQRRTCSDWAEKTENYEVFRVWFK